jgi:hypothetical protein
MPFVLGHALYRKAIHGGKAKHAKIDAHQLAGLRRGGMLPQASVYPAERRAPRDLLRRRLPLTRTRADLLTPVPQTHWQYNLPDLGQKIADNAHRHGVAARFPAPAVPQRVEGDRALLDG